jgi:outer membrane lipoprotein carrier protein
VKFLRKIVLLVSMVINWNSWALAEVDLFACGNKDSSLSRSEALQWVKNVQKEYSSIESISGEFIQRSFIVALDEGERSSGFMAFSKPGRMRWSYKTPRLQEVLIRDGVMTLYQVDTEQVIIQDVREVLLSALPVSFLMGIGELDRDFEVISGCHTSGGDVALVLEPSHQNSSSSENDELGGFVLLINPEKKVPIGAKITSVGGNITEIVFKNQKLNDLTPNAKVFVLEYPSSVDLVDRR